MTRSESSQDKTTHRVAIITSICAGIATIIGALIAGFRQDAPKVVETPQISRPSAPSQATSGEFSPAISAGRDVSITIAKPDATLSYETPIINSFRGYHDEIAFVFLRDGRRVPVTLTKASSEPIEGRGNYTVEFEILNKSKADIKIRNVAVEVVNVAEIEPMEYAEGFMSLGAYRVFTCRIERQLKKYESNFTKPGIYLLLKGGEQETVQISINTKDEGRYLLRALLELSTVDGIKVVPIGEVSDVRMIDRDNYRRLLRNRPATKP